MPNSGGISCKAGLINNLVDSRCPNAQKGLPGGDAMFDRIAKSPHEMSKNGYDMIISYDFSVTRIVSSAHTTPSEEQNVTQLENGIVQTEQSYVHKESFPIWQCKTVLTAQASDTLIL